MFIVPVGGLPTVVDDVGDTEGDLGWVAVVVEGADVVGLEEVEGCVEGVVGFLTWLLLAPDGGCAA
jgi:hypothetical protein